jgi:alcohol dehydrogenase class IV
MALQHKLAHIVAGRFDLPHADTHAILLPHVIAFNSPAAESATALLARALGDDDPAAALFDLASRIGAPTNLGDLGFTLEHSHQAARLVDAATYDNVLTASETEALGLLEGARLGVRPSVHGAHT